jgi:mannose PTS system EIIA component
MHNLIFIVAHAPLASALRQCVAHVFAERMEMVQALDIAPEWSASQSLTQAQNILNPFDRNPVLLLTDVMGATPCNVARQVMNNRQGYVLAGVNLPMLWRAVAYQQEPMDKLLEKALHGGVQGIMQVDVKMAQEQNSKGQKNEQGNDHHQQ